MPLKGNGPDGDIVGVQLWHKDGEWKHFFDFDNLQQIDYQIRTEIGKGSYKFYGEDLLVQFSIDKSLIAKLA